ncbi:MAG: substrate-binding domain-containing protein [Nitrospirales bacterium]|nr:substrate-binding domain-containing protein [Nitrospirales bacterium]
MINKGPRNRIGKVFNRGVSEETVRNSLLDMRKAKGLTQSELATRAGLTRQALYAIECNHYLPSTSIALRLAKVLGCRVEDLFSLPGDEVIREADLLSTHSLQNYPFRVKVAKVGDRLIARPLSELGDYLNFVVPADGIATGPAPRKPGKAAQRVQVNFLYEPEVIEKKILIAGCDPSVFLAGEHVRHLHAMTGVTNWTMGSTIALKALLQNEVHIAGIHLVDARTGESNLPYLKRHVQGKDFLGIRFASWVQGLLFPRENPKGIRSVEDLGKPGIRLVNREGGSGARLLLDTLLKKAGISGQKIKGYEYEVSSHLEVARLIREGVADAGIGVESVARHYGLGFIPLRDEHYDLILRKAVLASHPFISRLFDAMLSRPFRRELQALGGYNLGDSGKSLEW